MDVREKLVEILRKPIFPRELVDPTEAVADYLLDNGVTVQEWISVDDKLPEKSGYYLVFADNGGREVLSYSKKYQAFNAFDDAYSEEYVIPVTHWTPMPNPPKGEERKDGDCNV